MIIRRVFYAILIIHIVLSLYKEEEKAQVDRYKQLLLKQRDIMIALTQRLVERDEQIMALQDELDAYDRHHKVECREQSGWVGG